MRVRFLRTACPACWLLDVSRLIASRMVFRAQGESPAPRSWKRRATCSRRVVRRVCSELIMWYRKLTILDFETPSCRQEPGGSCRSDRLAARLPGRNRPAPGQEPPKRQAVPAGRSGGSCKSTGRFLPDGRAGTASVGRFLRRSRAATAAPLLGAAPPLCGRFLT